MDPGVDLNQLHDNIVAAIAGQFPALQTVEAYREETERVTLRAPACLVELFELEAVDDQDHGTEQLPMMARFEARLIIGFREANAKREVRKLAAALAKFIRHQRWGLGANVAPAEVMGCYPDEFDPALDQYEVMRVEWQQVVYVGENVWTGEGVPVTEVLYSWAPKIGLPFRDNYRTLEEGGAIPE